MNIPVSPIFTPHHIEYLILDENLLIQSLSPGILHLISDAQSLSLNEDIRQDFPELFGLEETLNAVLVGEQESFDLKGISRIDDQGEQVYLDLYVMSYKQAGATSSLILFLENVTDKMALEQRLVQATNESALLLTSLRNSENYIQQIISSMADPLLIVNRYGTIKKVNQATQRLLEYPEKELLNCSLTQLFGEQNLLLQIIHQCDYLQENEVLQDIEVDCRTKSGKKLSIAFSCSVVNSNTLGSSNLPQKDFIYVGRDITKSQQAQHRLVSQYTATWILSAATTVEEAMPKLLRAICENLEWDASEFWLPQYPTRTSPDLLPSLNCMTRWVSADLPLTQLSDIQQQSQFDPPQGLLSRLWETSVPEWIEDIRSEPPSCAIAAAIADGMQTAFGIAVPAQEIVGILIFWSRDRRPQDDPVIETLIAITSQLGQFIQRKRTETALIESEANLAEAQAISHLGSWELTLATQTMTGSDEFFRILSIDPQIQSFTYLNFVEYIHPDERQTWVTSIERALTQRSTYELDFRIVRTDAAGNRTTRYLNSRGKTICNAQGEPVRLIGTVMDITERKHAEMALAYQKKQTERLLQNILPVRIAERLKSSSGAIAENFDDVTVLFADIVGFTELSSQISPVQLVRLLNQIFSKFDALTEHHQLEKIKTIGDAYMVVGGLPVPRADHARAIAEIALDMLEATAQFNAETDQNFSIRIGIHTGPVVAGVIGTKKFIYDLWGDTVNTASRMESHGVAGCIQVSSVTYDLLQDGYELTPRGQVYIKGKGEMFTYFLLGKAQISP
ncbi:PAS domain S-box protein [Desertifilum sp. FACHB-1129]|uniref:Adenylate cyclase n=1 Tax=Desertifilum tharense IPPAS B-1220 TaxID=1781255 RepID=A0A1E5QN84_9CYAN|nr:MULTISPECIES: adenylate/guanylate cyclase domain-containing protein [Desertifilum]MDA0208596.1 PAS domain S-box protein [Cyanobacteria bacterium FC1]MBD2312418.1 PAS domain S-box protein [Desertifilum sp. FACHB-1129]MBD2321201.1 PAS domain S-box protein [Desertifilum sp. FACHB-866]MBD2331492.1 PAS domain S-box protein [Desertifilum sp. FACHB-868]OEJ76100.1 hypothetical protein BH720_05965 [Desertifilum tharense IPPAS B-1220]